MAVDLRRGLGCCAPAAGATLDPLAFLFFFGGASFGMWPAASSAFRWSAYDETPTPASVADADADGAMVTGSGRRQSVDRWRSSEAPLAVTSRRVVSEDAARLHALLGLSVARRRPFPLERR